MRFISVFTHESTVRLVAGYPIFDWVSAEPHRA